LVLVLISSDLLFTDSRGHCNRFAINRKEGVTSLRCVERRLSVRDAAVDG
jgi:hypothetical protein